MASELQYVDIDFNNVSRPVNIPNPVNPGDGVNKAYADALSEGNAWKDSARVSTQSNINLASPGATIDTVTMTARPNKRVVVRNQSVQPDNGIYIWNGPTTPMTRAPDASTSEELEMATLYVEEGTDANVKFRQTQINFVLGSGNVIFQADSSSAPAASTSTAGIAAIATQSEVNAGSVTNKFVTPETLKAYTGNARTFSQAIGDGSATSFDVNHNLGTRNVQIAVFPLSGNYDDIGVSKQRPTINKVTILFNSAPAANAFQVVITG